MLGYQIGQRKMMNNNIRIKAGTSVVIFPTGETIELEYDTLGPIVDFNPDRNAALIRYGKWKYIVPIDSISFDNDYEDLFKKDDSLPQKEADSESP